MKIRKFLPFKDRPTLTSAVEYLYLTVISEVNMTFSGLRPEITLIQCTEANGLSNAYFKRLK